MSQRYRREGGQDGDRRSSRGNERGAARPGHQESDHAGTSERADEEPRTRTRTEEIDRHEGLCPEADEPEGDEAPDERQDLIEFLESQYTEDGPLAPARREELLREGCQIRIHEWDLGWSQ